MEERVVEVKWTNVCDFLKTMPDTQNAPPPISLFFWLLFITVIYRERCLFLFSFGRELWQQGVPRVYPWCLAVSEWVSLGGGGENEKGRNSEKGGEVQRERQRECYREFLSAVVHPPLSKISSEQNKRENSYQLSSTKCILIIKNF